MNGRGSANHSSKPEEVVARIEAERAKALSEMQAWSKVRWPYLIGCVAVFLAFFWWTDLPGTFDWATRGDPEYWWIVIGGGTAGGLLLYVYFVYLLRMSSSARYKEQSKLLSGSDIDTLQATLAEDFFTKLVRINFQYIDQYYAQTQKHADRSFALSLLMSVAGFLIIGVGISLVFAGKVEAANVTMAGGVLSEFIGAVFFYLYNRTISKMSEYHRKLVLTQNLSVALKIAEALPQPERAKARQELITQLSQDINKLLMHEDADGREAKPVAT